MWKRRKPGGEPVIEVDSPLVHQLQQQGGQIRNGNGADAEVHLRGGWHSGHRLPQGGGDDVLVADRDTEDDGLQVVLLHHLLCNGDDVLSLPTGGVHLPRGLWKLRRGEGRSDARESEWYPHSRGCQRFQRLSPRSLDRQDIGHIMRGSRFCIHLRVFLLLAFPSGVPYISCSH